MKKMQNPAKQKPIYMWIGGEVHMGQTESLMENKIMQVSACWMTWVSMRYCTVNEDANLGPLWCRSVTQECPTLHNPMKCNTQASLSLTISQSLPKFKSIASVIPPSHLILWCLLLLLPSIFPSIRDFSNKSAFCIRWPKYWSPGPLSHPHICICYCCLVSKSCLTLASHAL